MRAGLDGHYHLISYQGSENELLTVRYDTGVVSIPNGVVFNNNSVTGDKTNVTLNAYEEGTWTPTFNANITTSGTPSGKYTRVGRLIHATCIFGYSALTGL